MFLSAFYQLSCIYPYQLIQNNLKRCCSENESYLVNVGYANNEYTMDIGTKKHYFSLDDQYQAFCLNRRRNHRPMGDVKEQTHECIA